MSMRWRKILGDARMYGAQIGAIAMVLVLGAAGVVACMNAQAVLKREIALSFAAAAVPDIALWFDKVEPDVMKVVAARDGIAATDSRRIFYTRVTANDGTWLPMRVTVMRDFSTMRLGVIHLDRGTWPENDGTILIEQSGQTLLNITAPLSIRTPMGDIATLPVGGFVHDPAIAPSTQERLIYAYMTPTTAARIGQNPNLDQLLVKMDYRASAGDAYELGNQLSAELARQGTPVLRMEVLQNTHPHELLMTAMLRVLGVLSMIAFTSSAALAGYMVAAWMRRETRQVGIMKTLGARSHQIAVQYLAMVTPMVLLTVAVALPLGALAGRALIAYHAVSLNIDIADWSPPGSLQLSEIALAFCIPLLAMFFPIARAARMTAHAAIHDAGISAPPRAGTLAARLVKFPGHVRWTFALRNSFRRPWRLLAMLLGLAAGGALLQISHSNYESLMRVVETSLNNQGHDMDVSMLRAAPAAELEAIARSVPEVDIAEAWRRVGVGFSMLNKVVAAPAEKPTDQNRRIAMTGFPPDTQLFRLPLARGRMPQSGARDEVVITRAAIDQFPELQLDRAIELQYRERKHDVKIVGVVEQIAAPAMYAGFATFDAATALGDASSIVRLRAKPGQIEPAVVALDRAFLDARRVPTQIISRAMARDSLDEHVKVVGDVVRMVALAAALIGAIILAAGTILNVNERLREIGILRTLGATPGRIRALFLAEGGAIIALAVILAMAIAIPLTLVMLNVAEMHLLHVAVPLKFSWFGFAILCSGALVVLLAVWVALRHALKRTVRETLAYE